MNDTHVLPAAFRLAATADLARLAFASDGNDTRSATIGPRHLAFLPPEALELDLSDPAQRDFGDYELLEKIGQGGMGVVYRVRQKALDREVALKLLAAGPWASTDFINRFRQEAQSAARMEHPNIVTVFETGSREDLHYFSMRLVRGESLATRLRDSGPWKPIAAARLMRTIAEAVDYAHRLGVLHLDLKPGNILIDEHGEPLVADFGLARRLDQVLAEQSNEVSGTPSYMAPEQAQAHSQRIGMATDIYGLGAIFYELLTGVPPFLAATPQETLQRVVTDEVQSPCERRPGIPADLEAICLKCLAKEPEARYAQARELAEDLGRFIEGRAVSVRPLRMPQRILRWARREPRLATAVVASVLALVIGLVATSQQWRRAEGNAEASRSLLWDSRREAAFRLEQDGKGYEALTRLLSNTVEEEHAGKTDAAALERRRIGMLLSQGATLIDRMVVADANPMAVEVSPDGRLMAMALNDETVRWYDTATLTERGRVSLDNLWSSDGQRRQVLLLRFVDGHRLRATFEWYGNIANPDDGDSWLIDLDHAALIKPPPAFADFVDATYSADGDYALLRDRRHQIQLWQTMPWKPVSALRHVPEDPYFEPWLLDPKTHFAAYITVAMRKVDIYTLPDLTTPHEISLPGGVGIFAWGLSHDGRTLALGDFEGRVFLLDTATRALRQLPKARGREITWVSFSEDDAWLAVASFDGAVHAFDVASGDSLVAGQMSHDFVVRRVGLSHSRRLLIASGEGQTALWRFPKQGPRALPAQRIGAGPAPHGLTGRYPTGWSLSAGLLATAGMDGQVRLWRLPTPPLRTAIAARQIPDNMFFDGRRLVDVEWNQLRIVSVSGVALTPWLKLPQPPGFAELVDDGRLLLLTTGPELRAYDTATLHLRYPPIPLMDSPERLVTNVDGSRVLLSFGGASAHGFVEQLQIFDARQGRRLPGEVVLPGQLRHLAFSADSTRILAVGPTAAATTVFATAGLHRIGEYPHDPFQPVQWADFAASGGDIMVVTRATDPRLGSDALINWDPVKDRVISKHPTGRAAPLGVAATDAGVFVAGTTQDLLVPNSGTPRILERMATSEAIAATALSPDRHLLARAFRREVQLYDATTMAAIGPPLQDDSDAIDSIGLLAFAPDNSRLLARTMQGHWLSWPIAPELRSTTELSNSLAHLSVGNENQKVVYAAMPSERAALRSRDPGRWTPSERRPAPVLALRNANGIAVPARSADTAPMLLDLSPYYDMGPDDVHNTYYSVLPVMRPHPVGVQRIAGTDFDLRGMAQMGGVPPNPLTCLAVPQTPVSAVHLLLNVSLSTPTPMDQAVASVILHYDDGSQATLPVRTGREVPGYAGQDQAVPFVFATASTGPMFGQSTDFVLSGPRLPNPHPERTIRCLDLEPDSVLVLFAISLEPVGSADANRPVVISGDRLRIDSKQSMVFPSSAVAAAPTSIGRSQ